MEIVLYIAAAVVLAAALAGALAYGFGWSPERWTTPLRASVTEAGERTSDWGAEFWRFLRSGR